MKVEIKKKLKSSLVLVVTGGKRGYIRKRNACRWTQLKFYWTLVKIINKWIHCHHVRIQWTKTMHWCVFFFLLFFKCHQYTSCVINHHFCTSQRRREEPHLRHVVWIYWGDIPTRWTRAHARGPSEFPLLGTWFGGTLHHIDCMVCNFPLCFSIDGHV